MSLRATEQVILPRNGRKAVRDDLPADVRAFPDSALLDPAFLEKDLGQLFGTLGDLRERNPFGNSSSCWRWSWASGWMPASSAMATSSG
jgi:hypothetical protein